MPRHKRSHTCSLNADRQKALAHLFEAHRTAAEFGRSAFNYACQLPNLLKVGFVETTLRALVDESLVEHHLELTRTNHKQRTFRLAPNLCFTASSCFLLSPTGISLIERLVEINHLCLDLNTAIPCWSASRRILSLGRTIVKRYRVPAENQELILSAFEEESWPFHLDDPLPPRPGIESKRRLHDAIKGLNRHRRSNLLRFEGDGTGCGVCWRLRASDLGNASPHLP